MKMKFNSITYSCALTGACAFSLLAGFARADTVLFDSWNRDGVYDNPPILPVFTLTDTWKITSILDYHWNSSAGQDPAPLNGKIEIFDNVSGDLLGSWKAHAVDGLPFFNTAWEVNPNLILGPGSYRIEDSGRDTWSYSITEYFVPPDFGPVGPDWMPYQGFSRVVGVAPESSTGSAGGVVTALSIAAWLRRRKRN